MGNILVIGDAMIDKHIFGDVKRLSPEAPVPIVNFEYESCFLGAAANVASQIATVRGACHFAYKNFWGEGSEHNQFSDMSIVTLSNLLDQSNITKHPLEYPQVGPVTIKKRIWGQNQQIARIDTENICLPDQDTQDRWLEQIIDIINSADIECIAFSDYNKGTLTDWLIQHVTDYCNERGNIITILDPKRHSYWGLQGLTVVKPNNKEVAITNKSPKEISEELSSTYLLHTLGSKGMKLWRAGRIAHREHIKILPDAVVDVCGCGDTVTAFLALALSSGCNMIDATHIANKAAAINTMYKGCHILDKDEVDSISEGEDGTQTNLR